MFDLPRITEIFSELLSNAADPASDGVLQHLAGSGFDPVQLQDLGVTDLLSQMSDLGVDVSALDAGQLSDIIHQLGQGMPANELISQLLEGTNLTR